MLNSRIHKKIDTDIWTEINPVKNIQIKEILAITYSYNYKFTVPFLQPMKLFRITHVF